MRRWGVIDNGSSVSTEVVSNVNLSGPSKATNFDFQIPLESLPKVDNAVASQIEPCELEERTLQFFNIYFVVSGTGKLMVNHVPQEFNFGNVYIWKPGDTWSGRIDTPHHALAVKFEWPGWITGRQTGSELIQLPNKIALKPEGQRRIKEVLDPLVEICLAKHNNWRISAAGYVYALLAALQREAGIGMSDKPALDRRLTLALSYMEEHLGDTLSVREIAEYASLSEDYFRRLFTRRMKMSPIKYLTLLRIREARRLMVIRPELTVFAAGRQVGFSDGRYFARIFRRHYGITPAAYRAGVSGPA
jgi:AraC family transcriptional regulator, arabinose operon regulatory protein